jgi:hypothetical protein
MSDTGILIGLVFETDCRITARPDRERSSKTFLAVLRKDGVVMPQSWTKKVLVTRGSGD